VSDTRANSIAPSRQFVLSACDIGLRRRNFFLSVVIAGNASGGLCGRRDSECVM